MFVRIRTIQWKNIAEICIAYIGKHIVPKHRVDGLRQLSAICLVNASSVNPGPLVLVTLRQLEKVSKLLRYTIRQRRGDLYGQC